MWDHLRSKRTCVSMHHSRGNITILGTRILRDKDDKMLHMHFLWISLFENLTIATYDVRLLLFSFVTWTKCRSYRHLGILMTQGLIRFIVLLCFRWVWDMKIRRIRTNNIFWEYSHLLQKLFIYIKEQHICYFSIALSMQQVKS